MAEKTILVDGEEYVRADRGAEVGDLIRILRYDGKIVDICAKVLGDNYFNHEEFCAEPISGDVSEEDFYEGRLLINTLISDQYATLEPKDDTPQTDRDLIIELAYTVSKMQREIDELKESESNNRKNLLNLRGYFLEVDDKAEMLIDDVAMLDERTQPLTDDGAKEFAEGLSDVIEEYVNDRMNSEQLTKEQIRRVYA